MGERHVRVILGDDFHFLTPEDRRFQHVRLVHRGHPLAAFASEVERDLADAADFRGGVDQGVEALAIAVRQSFDAARLAEIDAAGQLAHDHDVEARDHLALQRRRLGQFLEHDCRAQVGEQAHVLADAQQTTLRLLVEGHVVPLRATHRAHQHRVGGQARGHRLVGQGHAVRVDRCAADQPLGKLERRNPRRLHPRDDPANLRHHFLTDPVAGQQHHLLLRRHRFIAFHCAQPKSGDRLFRSRSKKPEKMTKKDQDAGSARTREGAQPLRSHEFLVFARSAISPSRCRTGDGADARKNKNLREVRRGWPLRRVQGRSPCLTTTPRAGWFCGRPQRHRSSAFSPG